MDEKLEFSIIIAAYNEEKYLKKCLDSILCQQFDSYEIIIIDDGSTDATGSIADEYGGRNVNIKVIHWENHGLILTRRKGLSLAKGEYVLFLDVDDFHLGESLFTLHKLVEKENPDAIMFRFRFIYENGENKDSRDFGKRIYLNDRERLFVDFSRNFEYNHLCCKAIKREILLKDTCNYEKFKRIKLGEDLLQTIPVFAKAYKIIMCDDVLYGYRILRNSMSHVFNFQQIEDIIAVYEYFVEYMHQEGLLTDNVKKAILSAYSVKLSGMMRTLWESDCTQEEKISYSKRIMENKLMESSMKHLADVVVQNRILLWCSKFRLWFAADMYSHLLRKIKHT
jgi:glycosyltransferase involved in cell wall biosynthesis